MYTKETLKEFIIENINAKRLVVAGIDSGITPIMLHTAFAEVSLETNIPIYATQDIANLINLIAGKKVATSTPVDIIYKGKGFLVANSVTIQKAYSLHRRMDSLYTAGLRVGIIVDEFLEPMPTEGAVIPPIEIPPVEDTECEPETPEPPVDEDTEGGNDSDNQEQPTEPDESGKDNIPVEVPDITEEDETTDPDIPTPGTTPQPEL